MSKECNGPDRSECCRRYGTFRRRASGCEAPSDEVKKFEALLEKKGTSGTPIGEEKGTTVDAMISIL